MFIVLEGIDGAGKGRQRNELIAHLQDKVGSLSTTDFPDHEGVLYEHIIHPALHEEIELSPESWFVTFALDHLLWQSKIKKAIGSKQDYFVADGYFTTNLVYQSLIGKNIDLAKALGFAKDFGIVEPDIVVFVDVDPEVAMERKQNEEGHDEGLDIYERSLEKQKNIRSAFKKMVSEQIFGDWFEVNGNNSIEEVKGDILNVLSKNNIF